MNKAFEYLLEQLGWTVSTGYDPGEGPVLWVHTKSQLHRFYSDLDSYDFISQIPI